ncbi:MAG: helix-turn-helix protein CopG [Cellvibrio sp.]|nr:helix-turn-helix protein CopG [Cellvibrio sp.]
MQTLPKQKEIMATLNISITEDMREWVDQQVNSGRYANASDYLRDLIRTNQSATDAIRLALIEGEQSGESTLNIDDIIEMEFPVNEKLPPV